jgi:hypothetical protein
MRSIFGLFIVMLYACQAMAWGPKGHDVVAYIAEQHLSKKALKNVAQGGYSFVEVLSVCPLNWRTNNEATWERLKTMEECFEVKEFLVKEGLE